MRKPGGAGLFCRLLVLLVLVLGVLDVVVAVGIGVPEPRR
jgi:hypothetical protein